MLATNTVNITTIEPKLLENLVTIPIHFKLAVSISLNFQITQTYMYPDDAAMKTEIIICKCKTIHKFKQCCFICHFGVDLGGESESQVA